MERWEMAELLRRIARQIRGRFMVDALKLKLKLFEDSLDKNFFSKLLPELLPHTVLLPFSLLATGPVEPVSIRNF